MWKSDESALHWNVDVDNVSLPLSMVDTSEVEKHSLAIRTALLNVVLSLARASRPAGVFVR